MLFPLALTWQLQSGNQEQLMHALRQAPRFGVGRIQLSHRAIHRIEDLWVCKNPQQTQKGGLQCLELVQNVVRVAKEQNLKVDLWTHEISGATKQDLERWKGWGEIDDWLKIKYQKAFQLVPNMDGIVLTLAETELCVYTNGDTAKQDLVSVVPSLKQESPAERTAHVIKTMHKICQEAGKVLIVRSFVYEPAQLEEFIKAVWSLDKEVLESEGLIFMSKCVPHDWQPYYPHSPDIGRLPNQLVEMDHGQEFTGQNLVMRDEVDYTSEVVNNALKKRVKGFVVRIERYENTALGTPNEVNLFAASCLVKNPASNHHCIRVAWIMQRFNISHEKFLVADTLAFLMKRTYRATNLTLFPLQCWTTNHSQLPSQQYIDSSLQNRKITKWLQDDLCKKYEELLDHPSDLTLTSIKKDKDRASILIQDSREDLESIKEKLGPEVYAQFAKSLSVEWVKVFRYFQLATFGGRYYQTLPDGPQKEALCEKIKSWIQKLRPLYENPSVKEYFSKVHSNVGDPVAHFRKCCDELEKMVSK